MELKTKRLLLRPPRMMDIDEIIEGAGNLEVSKWLLVVPHPYKRKDVIDWIKSYGSEALEAVLDFAFNKLKLRRLEAGVIKGNPGSRVLLEKFGFKLEGTKRRAIIPKSTGKITDEHIYGLLKE